MSIKRFFTKSITVNRNAWVEESGYSHSEEATVGTIKGHIQQTSAEMATNLALNLSTSFSLWCAVDTDIKVGDRVVCDGISYTVRLIMDNSFVGLNAHLEVYIEKENEQS